MLNIFSDMIATATRQDAGIKTRCDSERRKFYIAQSRRARRLGRKVFEKMKRVEPKKVISQRASLR